MNHVRGADRTQTQLLPPCLEDYVPANAPVRFLDAFVETLNLQSLGFTHAQTAATGRPPYHPADLLKLYIYGYLNRIRSSRRLELETQRNLELMWLLRSLRPDFKTIADFRKDNRVAFKGVLKQFNLLCRQLNLFGAELLAIDGSKFKAVNSPRRHYTKQQLAKLNAHIEGRIEKYLGELDSQDTEHTEANASDPSLEALNKKIAQLRERQQGYNAMLEQMKQTQQNEISLTDSDSRWMKKVGVGYNVQIAVDDKHDLIVEEEVVQAANDLGQLSDMAEAAKETLAVEQVKAVADAGYHEAGQLQACETANIETYVPDQERTSGQSANGKKVYPKEVFHYDAQTDSYHCPAGEVLPRVYRSMSRGKQRDYYHNVNACRHCKLRKQCTSGAYRQLSRLENEVVVERQAQRVKAHPEIVARRKEIVEHVFGTLRIWGHDIFLMKGLEKVRCEFSISALCYNLKRVLKLVTWDKLMAARNIVSPIPVTIRSHKAN